MEEIKHEDSQELTEDEPIIRKEGLTAWKALWGWMLVPMFEGFGQTLALGVMKRALIGVIRKIRGTK